MSFMLPADQARLRECMTYTSLLDELLGLLEENASEEWFRRNARAYLEVCELFGQYAAQHHDGLVKRFIEEPASKLSKSAQEGLTASGPPLPVLLRSLEVLRDMRVASQNEDLQRLRKMVG